MTENEKLRALLAEAQHALLTKDDDLAASLDARIDAALAEPMVEECPKCEENRTIAWAANSWSSGHDCGEEARDLYERAGRMEKERDEARAEVARLRWGNEMACENTPTKGCECPGCGLARERAERGEVGP